ncbi:MAG: DNA (Cytosine-5-)-methyltransferase domain [Geobacteraceae bacterium]|nr:MAG: DNA (Cytosine-5-)-methyltransferase domain [Geobacteraceae bacterium]
MTYEEFLKSKVAAVKSYGVEIEATHINPILKPHQAAIVRWMVEGGRRDG